MANYLTIHTLFGLQALADAEVGGGPINLTHMAVGDGNGNPVTPDAAQDALVREVYRATINRLYKPEPTNQPTMYAAELIVPASEGGFVMREVGLFDADGNLFLIGNLPDTYKPTALEGSFSDSVVRVIFQATNDSVITLQLDPNVAVATQQWIENNITAAFLLPGGTTGQVLRKTSNADGHTEWADPTDVNVVVNTVEEEQTLADAQVNVDLALTNTTGLAIYIEGVRLPKKVGADGWQPDGVISTRAVLGQSYPAGSKLIAVQNEPASDLPDALRKDQNLADVPDKGVARTSLDVYNKSETDQKAPAGMVAPFARNTAPSGWLKANGAAVSRTTYATLFAAIGTTFGAGDGFNTFNLPDLRGEFVRGWDDGRGIDTGRAFGSQQSNGVGSLTLPARTSAYNGSFAPRWLSSKTAIAIAPTTGAGSDSWEFTGPDASIGPLTDRAITLNGGTSETRPRSRALLYCIKF